jgi:cytochrome c553
MISSINFRTSIFAACLLLSMQHATAGDVVAGRNKAEMMCANCHGVDGIATLPGAANLAGQQNEYLRGQLKAYRSGSRVDSVMGVVAKTLTDDDISNLAAWYSSIKVTVEAPAQ